MIPRQPFKEAMTGHHPVEIWDPIYVGGKAGTLSLVLCGQRRKRTDTTPVSLSEEFLVC
jgi:hypothetical protein